MKKVSCLFLVLALLFSFHSFPVAATTHTAKNTIEYFEDGSYCITECSVARSTSSYTKTKTYYSADNTRIFALRLTGYFTYNGISATAVDETASVTIYHTDAKNPTSNAYRNGAGVYGSGSVNYLGSTKTLYLSITCSPNGTFT